MTVLLQRNAADLGAVPPEAYRTVCAIEVNKTIVHLCRGGRGNVTVHCNSTVSGAVTSYCPQLVVA